MKWIYSKADGSVCSDNGRYVIEPFGWNPKTGKAHHWDLSVLVEGDDGIHSFQYVSTHPTRKEACIVGNFHALPTAA